MIFPSFIRRFFLPFVGLGIILTLLLGQVPQAAVGQSQHNREQSGAFDSIIIDFQETPQTISTLTDSLSFLSQTFNVKATLNSEFSAEDNVYVMPGDRKLLEQLQQSQIASKSEFIEPNYIYSQTGTAVNDPGYTKQWNFQQIEMEGAWKRGANGQGATVAVIDTGVSKGPDLTKTKFVQGYDFVNNRTDASDDNGHGTHVAGTIAQSTNNKYGVAGIAYGSKIMPLKVLSRGGSGTISDIAEAIRFAADHGADVINMSLGGGGDSKLMREAINYAHKKGVVIIAAAGNESRSRASYPAYYPNVIAVSAVGPNKKKTSYSNYGDGVDIAAPGGATSSNQANGILQETINPRDPKQFVFQYFQGTSMAAPHVAGVAALIRGNNSGMSPDAVWKVLKSSALPIKDDSQNYYGAGILNAAKAVAIASPMGGFNLLDMILKVAIALVLTGILIPRGRGFKISRPTFWLGVMMGSIGLFFCKLVNIPFIPQPILGLVSSSIPELGSVLTDSSVLNPIFVSLLIPFGLMALLISSPWRWYSLGVSIGMMSFMIMVLIGPTSLWLLGSGLIAKGYLLVNVLAGGLITVLFARVALD